MTSNFGYPPKYEPPTVFDSITTDSITGLNSVVGDPNLFLGGKNLTATGETGGSVSIQSGNGNVASGDISLTAGSGITTGDITITTTDSTGAGDAGDILLVAGEAGGAGTDGNVSITTKGIRYDWPVDTPVAADALTVASVAAGVATLEWAPDPSPSAGSPNDIQLAGPSGDFAAATLSAFNFVDNAVTPQMNAGAENGDFTIQAVAATTATASGSALSVVSGDGNTTGNGGAISIVSGNSGAGASGNGGALALTAGSALSTNGNGGSIVLVAGTASGSGTPGGVSLSAALGEIDITSTTVDVNAAGAVTIDSAATSRFITTVGSLNLGAAVQVDVTAAEFDVNTTGSVTIDAAATSNFTTTAGDLNLTSAAGMNLAAAAGEVDVTSASLDVNTTGAVTIDSAATSRFITTVGSLNLGAAVQVDVTAAEFDVNTTGSVTIDAAATSNFTTTAGDLNLTSAANMNLAASAGQVDVTSATFDVNTTGAVTIDAAATSNFTTTVGNLNFTGPNINLSSSGGQVDVTSATFDVNTTGAVTIDASATSNFTTTAGNLNFVGAVDVNFTGTDINYYANYDLFLTSVNEIGCYSDETLYLSSTYNDVQVYTGVGSGDNIFLHPHTDTHIYNDATTTSNFIIDLNAASGSNLTVTNMTSIGVGVYSIMQYDSATGIVYYTSSTAASKKNIRNLEQLGNNFRSEMIYDLVPRAFEIETTLGEVEDKTNEPERIFNSDSVEVRKEKSRRNQAKKELRRNKKVTSVKKDIPMIGFIAEEVAAVHPVFALYRNEADGTETIEGINYDRWIAPIICEMKKLRDRITELENRRQ